MREWSYVRSQILDTVMSSKVKVSIFLTDELQTQEGTIVLVTKGTVMPGIQPIGTVNLFGRTDAIKGNPSVLNDIQSYSIPHPVNESIELCYTLDGYYSSIGDNLYSEDKAEIRKIKKEGNSVAKGVKDSDYYRQFVDQAKSIKAIEDFNNTLNPVTEITDSIHKDAFSRIDKGSE